MTPAETATLEQARLTGVGSELEAALMTKLEAAEKERGIDEQRIADLMGELNRVGHENDALRAAMEKIADWYGSWGPYPETNKSWCAMAIVTAREAVKPLYLAPSAQPAQKAVAYLDLGAGGYMDIGTDLTDEQLSSLPKGRHMLGIVGTYGVDGYVSAQPAPSVPEGWKLVPTAESRHPGIYKMLGALHTVDNTPGASEWASDAAFLAAAPEVKPCP